MKVSSDQYAKLLYEASKTSKESEKKALLKGVADLIRQNGDVAKLNSIEMHYRIIEKKDLGQLEGLVYSAKRLDESQMGKIQRAVATQKNIANKLIVLKNEVDLEMKGGFIVKFENEILDGSLDSKIARVREALVL
ncbi:MAG: F0F1 ATP synthase subunit delta [Candidatus Moranbacteria bacterium]|nr:F0F1 ATP synthase subunit delta [Candidatus Moranbacteria bacterium]